MKLSHGKLSRRSMLWSAAIAWLAGGRNGGDQSLAQGPYLSPSIGGQKGTPELVPEVAVVEGDLGAMLRTAVASWVKRKDETGRTMAGEIKLPAGRYRLRERLELAPSAGFFGLIISGVGPGTEIVFEGAAATIECQASRGITFRDLAFRSAGGIDEGQAAFTIEHTGNPLRSWRFERCEFAGFYRCFLVRGAAMASEFFFDKCQFSQCYHLMDNDNDQAVNWNFVNCNWENSELRTRRDIRLSAAFSLKSGTFVTWTGGSLIFLGRLVLYQLTAAGRVQRTAHMIAFEGVRIELEDEGKGHVPFVDRIDADYVSGTNQPTTTFQNCTVLHRGDIPSPTTYARVWANCSVSFVNCKAEGGRIIGVLDGVSPNQTANIIISNCKAISYLEDRHAQLNSHDQHSLMIIPDQSSAGTDPIIEQRLCSFTAPGTLHPKYMYVRGPTGSLPLGGSTVTLTPLPDHTMILRMFVRRFQAAQHPLIIELRDGSETGVHGRLVLQNHQDRFAEVMLGAEMGFQIATGVPLILHFIGVAEDVKGIVGVEYL